MAEVVRYVDPDATGAGNGASWTDAYTSLATAEAALDGGSNSGDNLIIYCRSSGGTADTTNVVISGFTYDSVTIKAAEGHEALKTGWSTSRYRLSISNTDAISITEAVTLDGLQIENTYVDDTSEYAVNLGGSGTFTVTMKNCRIRVTNSGGNYVGVYQYATNSTLNMSNCIIDGAASDYRPVYIRQSTATLYHCVVRGDGSDPGIFAYSGATVTLKNCAVFNTDDDFENSSSTLTIDHCASDDGDGTNAVAPSDSDWDNEFNALASGDFTLLATGNLYHAGVSGTGVSTDIDGDNYDPDNPSIGVDEYIAAGGTTAPTGALSGPLVGALGGPIGD